MKDQLTSTQKQILDWQGILPNSKLKLICCICGKVIRDGPDEPVSHGYCNKCAEIELKKVEEMKL